MRGFGLKVGPSTPARFEGRIRELVAGQPGLEAIAQGLAAVRAALRREFDRFEKQVRAMARCQRARATWHTLVMRFPSRKKSLRYDGAPFSIDHWGGSFKSHPNKVHKNE
jgi:hypothetical protein